MPKSGRNDYRSLKGSEEDQQHGATKLSARFLFRRSFIGGCALLCIATLTALINNSSEHVETFQEDWLEFYSEYSSPYVEALGVYTAGSSQRERQLTGHCLEEWISHGRLCEDVTCSEDTSECPLDENIDFVWTWANASSKLWSEAREAEFNKDAAFRKQLGSTAIKHFRTHDELKYSIRSVADSLGAEAGSFHILSTDLASLEFNNSRYGMIPTWLDLEMHKIQVQFPWNTYKTSSTTLSPIEWRQKSLPTFQSHSIEATFPFLANVSDTWIYMCDDFFILEPSHKADLYSPLLGFTFRVQRDMTVPSKGKEQFLVSAGRKFDGEWPGLSYSNWLLDKRYGAIERPYPVHTLKLFSAPILREISDIWADELAETASLKFRGSNRDTNMAFLFLNHVVERHREILLWSFLVARIDENEDGAIDAGEKREMLRFLTMHPGNRVDGKSITVASPTRKNNDTVNLGQAGWLEPIQTEYTVPSTNGYAYVSTEKQPWGRFEWPNFHASDDTFCTLPLDCIGQYTEPAQDLFKRVAFQQRKCGDCLIVALLHLSGEQGFSAFLPPSRQDPSPVDVRESIRVLPKTKTWEEADFSLAAIADELDNGESYQTFCMRLIHRYSYVMADTSFHFVRMSNARQLDMQLEYIRQHPKALLVLNDDVCGFQLITHTNFQITSNVNQIDERLHGWFEQKWPIQKEWEL